MDTEHNCTPVDRGEYTIIWKFMPDDWAKGISRLQSPGAMPYFVDGEAYRCLQNKEKVELTPYALLCGILLSWFESEKFWMGEQKEPLQRFLSDVLEDLRQVFDIPSVEEMILSVAASVREKHGPLPASRMLTVGNNILPGSAKIRSDLINDVWAVLEGTDQVDRESAFRFIVSVYGGIDFEDLSANAIEVLDYVYMASLAFLGKTDERDTFFWQTASKRVSHPRLKERMFRLLEDCEPKFDTYRVWSRKELLH